MVLACLANFETNEALAPRFGVEDAARAKIVKGRLTGHVILALARQIQLAGLTPKLAKLVCSTTQVYEITLGD